MGPRRHPSLWYHVWMSKQPEGKIVQAIKAHLTDRGHRVFKIQGSDESFQEVGIPDLLCCVHGWFVGLEVKQSGGEASPRQLLILRQIYEAGGVAGIVESVAQVASLLGTLDREAHAETIVGVTRGMLFSRGRFISDPAQLQ